MRIALIFIFFFKTFNLFAIEVKCNFEEVYQNGETQQGIFFIKEDKLRYEYSNKNLFSIISNNNSFYLINLRNTSSVQKLNENTKLLEKLIKISLKYPNINNYYEDNGFKINIEKSQIKFIKRVSVRSNDLNMSINIFDCSFEKINNKYFNPFNFIEHKIQKKL